MKWFGHVLSADNDIIRKLITETIHKKRPIGRPRMRWNDAVEKDIKMLGRNVSVDMALNSERWRGLLVADWQLRSYKDCQAKKNKYFLIISNEKLHFKYFLKFLVL